MTRLKAWTPDEDRLLLGRHDGTSESAERLAQELGRTKAAVLVRCSRLGLAVLHAPWRDEDLEILDAQYPNQAIAVADLAKRLGRTLLAVRVRAQLRGLCRRNGEHCRWQPEEDELVLAAAGKRGGAIAVAEQIGRTPGAVRMRLFALRRRWTA